MVGSTINKTSFSITSGSSSPLPLTFRYDDDSWVYVVAYAADGDSVVNLVLGTDYDLTGDGVTITGNLVLDSSFLATVPAGGMTLIAYRIAPALQTLDLSYNTRLPSEAIERALDVLAMASIDRQGILQNALRYPLSDPASFASSYEMPAANLRKGTVVGHSDSEGRPIPIPWSDVANRVLAYYGLSITSEDVLAAISAVAPLRLSAPPTNDTPGKFGQLAVTAGAFNVLTEDEEPFTGLGFYDVSIINEMIHSPFLEAGEKEWPLVDGQAGSGKTYKNYSVTGIDPYSPYIPTYEVFIRTELDIQSNSIVWKIGGVSNGLTMGGWLSDGPADSPSEVEDWIIIDVIGPTVTGDVSLSIRAPQVWIQTSEGIVSQWKRLLTSMDFDPSLIPTEDTYIRGSTFLDGTVFNISLGPP